jgi:hypothetical protein
MATFRLPHFSSHETLAAIDRRRLIAFLDPHRDYFAGCGVELPSVDSEQEIDCEGLVRAFLSPGETTPRELIDSLYYVDGMSTPQAMEDLLEGLREARLPIDVADDVTPADLAVQVWLQYPDLLERKHAEQYLLNPRSFEHYLTDDPDVGAFTIPDAESLHRLETVLNDWFEGHKRGRTARVFIFPRPDAVWFMVRHGEPYKREGSVVGDEPSSVAYRPLKYDVLVYTPARKELRVNAKLKGERKLYRTEFGRHLFGGVNTFTEGAKYTLEPLRVSGEQALVCSDVPGVESITLAELHYRWGGKHREYEIVRASDLFAAMKDRNAYIPNAPTLARALFRVKFADVKQARSVIVTLPTRAQYTRDEDCDLIEAWLKQRGFLNVCDDDSHAHPVLAGA